MGLNVKDINNILNSMHSHKSTAKGAYGEKAAFAICEEFYQKQGGILIHSYSYKVDPQCEGNIKRNENGLYIENLGSTTEIDILYVSKFRVFPIEVKAYKAKTITLYDDRISGCKKTDKSPVHQNEMHCRHLYSSIFRGLPDGGVNRPVNIQGLRGFATEYIVPIVVFVDEAEVIDSRSEWQQDYMKLAILDTLRDTIIANNTPLDYQLNLNLMETLLKEAMTSSEKFLPARV